MKNKINKTLVFLVIFSSNIAVSQCTDGSAILPDDVIASESEAYDSLKILPDEDIINGILYMREEEKVARDVYLKLNEIYPLRPFQNISNSEQAHMDAIAYLINLYELEDPVGDNPQGIFTNEDLQKMYNDLIESGSKSKIDALKVGALIEEVDIIDLQNELEKALANDELTRVYTNLAKASENHLRAFVRVLKMNGVEYEPVKLSTENYNSIIEK